MHQPLPKATPELAKKVWEAQNSPSARSVAQALMQAGRPVHFTTVSRLRRDGWRADPTEHPLERARADLEAALPLVTGHPASTIEDLIRATGRDNSLGLLSSQPQTTGKGTPNPDDSEAFG